MYIYIYIYIYTHTYIHTYIHTYTYVCICTSAVRGGGSAVGCGWFPRESRHSEVRSAQVRACDDRA